MNDGQAELLLEELVATRRSFDNATNAFNGAINQIRWNRINTIIQYALIAIVLVMIGAGVVYYLDEKHEACERGNELRAQITVSLDYNAASIGGALAAVTGASPEIFGEYMAEYNSHDKPPILELRDC